MIIREPGDEASTSMYLQKAVVSRTLVYIRIHVLCLPQHACLISFPAYPFNCDDIALAAYIHGASFTMHQYSANSKKASNICTLSSLFNIYMGDEAQGTCFLLLSFELKFVYCDPVCLEKIICIFFG